MSNIQIHIKRKIIRETRQEDVGGALNLYPEEKLHERSDFKKTFSSGRIGLKVLCRKISFKAGLLWRLFFYNSDLIRKQLAIAVCISTDNKAQADLVAEIMRLKTYRLFLDNTDSGSTLMAVCPEPSK